MSYAADVGTDPVEGPGKLAAAFERELSLASRAIHADDYINNHQAVAPPLHVSSTYRYSHDPDKLQTHVNINVGFLSSGLRLLSFFHSYPLR